MKRRALSVVAALALAGSLTAPAAQAAPKTADPQFDFSSPDTVASNLDMPWDLDFLPDGSALVTERDSARILQMSPGSEPKEVARLSGVVPGGEGGLMGLAVSPDYEDDGYIYAYYTAASDNRIVRFQLAPSPNQEVILSGIPKAFIHNGGRLQFGPDGMLYAGTGDAGRSGNAQNPNSLGGKILRMQPDGSPAPDNPNPSSVVYTLGHRNVQGLAWDAQNMYNVELGNNTWDEVNHIEAGENYGWPNAEGPGGEPTYRDPIVWWRTSEASPSGGAVVGDTLYVAALRGTRLWTVPLDGLGGTSGDPVAELRGTYGRLRGVAFGPDGHLWITTSNRDRGRPAPEDDRVIRFPQVDEDR